MGGQSFIEKKSTGTLSMTSDDLKISLIFLLKYIHTEIILVELKQEITSILPEFLICSIYLMPRRQRTCRYAVPLCAVTKNTDDDDNDYNNGSAN